MVVTIEHIPKGPNRPGKKLLGVKAIVVHYTGNDMPTADAAFHVRWLSRDYVLRDGKYYEKDGITQFRLGSAHCFCDTKRCIETIPTDEVAWGCGDNNHGGYTEIARTLFRGLNNYYTINVEICNYNIIPLSDKDWEMAESNAIEYIRWLSGKKGWNIRKDVSYDYRLIGTLAERDIILMRHFDVTHKRCPEPLIDINKWHDFIRRV